ncbi:MAG: glutathione S-transferase family protein [Beijerinckiaceae bacterium]|nr:glutathione S-transferase family protein [Beijerinckiaceae bacterium]
MITLYTFGPYFGLPDGSPFVTKAMILLKMAGLAYREDRGGYAKAPKGKLPYIDDEGVRVADTTFIRRHIETKYGFDFDDGLTPEQKATAWALERMCEDHLYWAVLDARWLDETNFAKGPAHFFDAVPAPIRGLVARMIQRKMRKTLEAQGLGRHCQAEIESLGRADIEALAVLLGDKPYFFGETPKGGDATLGAFMLGLLTPVFVTPLRATAENHGNLVAYAARIKARFFPEG